MGVRDRVDVLGVGISVIDMPAAVKEIGRFIREGRREYVCITGVHGVMECQRDPVLMEIHNRSGLTTPDGMPMVWAGRWVGAPIERVYGPDLMLEICARGQEPGWRHFLYGGAQGVPELLAGALQRRFSDLQIVGTHSPPFRELSESELSEVVQTINESHADIVWVGLSTPKQERWMHGVRPLLNTAVLVGVGAAFDIHTGRTRQAPSWMQKTGLEWLFRLLSEPRRLWRRYFYANPRFIWRILRRPPKLQPYPEEAASST